MGLYSSSSEGYGASAVRFRKRKWKNLRQILFINLKKKRTDTEQEEDVVVVVLIFREEIARRDKRPIVVALSELSPRKLLRFPTHYPQIEVKR